MRPWMKASKPKGPTCRGCRAALTDPSDVRVLFCKKCLPPHGAPSCGIGFASCPPKVPLDKMPLTA